MKDWKTRLWKWMGGGVKSVVLAVSLTLILPGAAQAEGLRIAAAADLKFAMDELVRDYGKSLPGVQDRVEVVYGSSGKFFAQIQQGAPYDLFFSADISYPRQLLAAGAGVGVVIPYAVGRLTLWSSRRDAENMSLDDLADPSIRRIALANPKHAPYGKRAEEALRAAGVWEKVEHKLVYGENIAQAAQYVQTGNADVGMIALSLALHPELARQGGYRIIPAHLHQALDQGFVMTRRAVGNSAAQRFSDYMRSAAARAVMERYGFALPAVR